MGPAEFHKRSTAWFKEHIHLPPWNLPRPPPTARFPFPPGPTFPPFERLHQHLPRPSLHHARHNARCFATKLHTAAAATASAATTSASAAATTAATKLRSAAATSASAATGSATTAATKLRSAATTTASAAKSALHFLARHARSVPHLFAPHSAAAFAAEGPRPPDRPPLTTLTSLPPASLSLRPQNHTQNRNQNQNQHTHASHLPSPPPPLSDPPAPPPEPHPTARISPLSYIPEVPTEDTVVEAPDSCSEVISELAPGQPLPHASPATAALPPREKQAAVPVPPVTPPLVPPSVSASKPWLRRGQRRHEQTPRVRRLHRQLVRLANTHSRNMRLGVAVVHLESGEEVGLNAEEVFPLASVVKVPIMMEAVRQLEAGEKVQGDKATRLQLDTPMRVEEAGKCIGAGLLRKIPSGSMVSFADTLELMQVVSDNTAADMILQAVGLPRVQALTHELRMHGTSVCLSQRQAYLIALGRCSALRGKSSRQIAHLWRNWSLAEQMAVAQLAEAENNGLAVRDFMALECRAEKLQRVEGARGFEDDVAVAGAVDNQGSPEDTARLFAQLGRGELFSAPWTSLCLGIFSRQRFGTRRLPRSLPKGTPVYHKTGTILGVVNDAGIIQTPSSSVAVAAFVDNIKRNREREAEAVIARVGRLVYDAYTVPHRRKRGGKVSPLSTSPADDTPSLEDKLSKAAASVTAAAS